MKTEFEAKWYPLPKPREEFEKDLNLIGAELLYKERIMKQVLYGKEKNPPFQRRSKRKIKTCYL